jgi:Protein of unknown function (DUF3667)
MEILIENTCKNCSQDITENFCSNCGQKKFKRIDKKYIWDEIQYTIFHWNKGVLFSIKKLISNPGKTARAFVEGNRVNHYKPISLVFLLSGIGAFLSFKVLGFSNVMKEQYASNKAMNTGFMSDYLSFVNNYNAFIMLAFIPIIALFTKLVFRKWGHNYYEHIVMNAYGLSCYSVLSMLVMYPILYFVKHDVQMFGNVTLYSFSIIPVVMVWFFKGFYPEKKLTTIIFRVLLMIILTIFCLVILCIGAVIIIAILNPDSLKAFVPAK